MRESSCNGTGDQAEGLRKERKRAGSSGCSATGKLGEIGDMAVAGVGDRRTGRVTERLTVCSANRMWSLLIGELAMAGVLLGIAGRVPASAKRMQCKNRSAGCFKTRKWKGWISSDEGWQCTELRGFHGRWTASLQMKDTEHWLDREPLSTSHMETLLWRAMARNLSTFNLPARILSIFSGAAQARRETG